MVLLFLEAIALAASLSLDTFVSSMAFGGGKVKIPFVSAQIINFVCSLVLGVSLWLGAVVRPFLPGRLTSAVCFGVLFVLGMAKVLDGITKSWIKKHTDLNKEFNFAMFNLRFILSLRANPEAADVDRSRSISKTEAVSLAFALSLDGLAVGFGAAIGHVNAWAVVAGSLVANTLAVILGCRIGERIASKTRFNLSWVSGAILIILGVSKLL